MISQETFSRLPVSDVCFIPASGEHSTERGELLSPLQTEFQTVQRSPCRDGQTWEDAGDTGSHGHGRGGINVCVTRENRIKVIPCIIKFESFTCLYIHFLGLNNYISSYGQWLPLKWEGLSFLCSV